MSEEIKYAYLKSHPLFACVEEEKTLAACSTARFKSIVRGEKLHYGERNYSKIFLLIKGKIKITESDEGDNELIKDILTAPDVFGDLSLQGNPSSDEYAEALTANTVVCVVNVIDFKVWIQDNPEMALTYANILNNKLKRLEKRHSDLVFRDAKSRLIKFIKNWAISDGCRIGNKIVLNNYLTHSDIAGVIASSRQSVNVLFNELRESGILFYDRKTIELPDGLNWK